MKVSWHIKEVLNMNVIELYVKAIVEKYGLEESDIFISQVESFVFDPEELEGVVQNSIVLDAPRLITTFPVKSVGGGRCVHVIADSDTYVVLEIVETVDQWQTGEEFLFRRGRFPLVFFALLSVPSSTCSLHNEAEFTAKEEGPSWLFAGPLFHIGLLESMCRETYCRIIIMRWNQF